MFPPLAVAYLLSLVSILFVPLLRTPTTTGWKNFTEHELFAPRDIPKIEEAVVACASATLPEPQC